jgi:glucose-1-phosphatase
MFLCGHDSNLASIGAALRMTYPETEQALELHTPIGSKLVFEKWADKNGADEYVAVNLVYQSVGQLQGRTLLSVDVPPMVKPVIIEGLTANSYGLYRLADVNSRFADAMAEYDAIVDDTSSASGVRTVSAPSSRAYTLEGKQVDVVATNYKGIIVTEQGKKMSAQ